MQPIRDRKTKMATFRHSLATGAMSIACLGIVAVSIQTTQPLFVPGGTLWAALSVPATAIAIQLVVGPRSTVLFVYGVICGAMFFPRIMDSRCYMFLFDVSVMPSRGYVRFTIALVLIAFGGCCVFVGVLSRIVVGSWFSRSKITRAS